MDFGSSKTPSRLTLFFLLCSICKVLNIPASGDLQRTSCDIDYQQKEVANLSAIADEGRGIILGAITANGKEDCARLCCDMFEDFNTNQNTCNTAVYLPNIEDEENCFMFHCNTTYCGQDFLLDTETTEGDSYVIFLKMFHDLDLSSTKANLEQTQSAHQLGMSTFRVSTLTSTQSPGDAENDTNSNVDDRETTHLSSNVLASSDKEENIQSDNASEFGAIILATFVCLSVAAATVLIANKCYQTYEKRKLYDKLDYLSAEPLYSSSTLKD